MDLDDFFEAIEEIGEWRKDILSADVSLTIIKKVLFSYFKIKEPSKPNKDPLKAIKNFPSFKVTKNEMDAWYKAGCPNPSKFFKKQRVLEIK